MMIITIIIIIIINDEICYNKTGNVRINITLSRVRATIVAVEKK